MKNLLDKPYKTNLFVTIIFTIALILTNVYAEVNKTSNIYKSKDEVAIVSLSSKEVKSETTEIKSETKEVKSETETKSNDVVVINEPKDVPVKRSQKKKEVIVSRGSSGAKQLSQREIINTYVKEICSKYNIDPYLIMSVIESESTYNPKCTTGNCLGLMQVSKTWHSDRARKLGVKDFYDPYGNILLGVDYISELLKTYKDPRLVLMLYNMDHKTAITMYRNGQVSTYARTVLARAEQYRKGE
jgi:hypothetical protein